MKAAALTSGNRQWLQILTSRSRQVALLLFKSDVQQRHICLLLIEFMEVENREAVSFQFNFGGFNHFPQERLPPWPLSRKTPLIFPAISGEKPVTRTPKSKVTFSWNTSAPEGPGPRTPPPSCTEHCSQDGLPRQPACGERN